MSSTDYVLGASTHRSSPIPMDTSTETHGQTAKKVRSRRKPSRYNEFIRKTLHREHGDPAILQLPNGERMRAAAKKWLESEK